VGRANLLIFKKNKDMNKIRLFLLACLSTLFISSVAAQPYIIDFGIFNSPLNSNRLEVRLKTTQTVTNGAYSAGIFTVRYLSTYGVNLSMVSSPYSYGFPTTYTDGTYNYVSFSFVQSFTVNWTAGTEYLVAILEHSNNGVGNGDFELITNVPATDLANGNFYQELNGNESQNTFYQSTTSSPLPVSLLHFNAKLQENKTVQLDWRSEAEKNLLAYEVEHSANGHDFSKIGQVAAKGSPVTQASYEFTHNDPQAGSNYYRLRMSDRWGKTEYSPVRIIRMEVAIPAFQVLPNPTSGPISLIVNQLEQFKDDLYYQVTDVNGKLLLENRLIDSKTAMDFSNYPSGAYYLNVRTEREQLHQFKLVVTPK
jgi:hypothetical protein